MQLYFIDVRKELRYTSFRNIEVQDIASFRPKDPKYYTTFCISSSFVEDD